VDKSRAKQLHFGLPHVTVQRWQRQPEMPVSFCLPIPCFPPSTQKVPNLFETLVFDLEPRSPGGIGRARRPQRAIQFSQGNNLLAALGSGSWFYDLRILTILNSCEIL
jgi:hypothetical protein